jgi:hypothetical protein
MSEVKQLQIMPQANFESLISQAIDKNIDVTTMEKLLAMYEKLKAQHAKEEYYKALSSFQADCPEIKKEAKVDFTNKTGKRTKYNYATLDMIVSTVKTILKNNGFSYTIKAEQTKEGVTAICNTFHVAGHKEETQFFVPYDLDAYMNIAQKAGSALTYAKRYAFCNAWGIMTADQDDDAISAGNPGGPNTTGKPGQKPAVKQQSNNRQIKKPQLTKRQETIKEIGNIMTSGFFSEDEKKDMRKKISMARKQSVLDVLLDECKKILQDKQSNENEIDDAEYEKIDTSKFDKVVEEAESELKKACAEVGELFKGVDNE